MEHKDFVVYGRAVTKIRFYATGDVSAYLYFTPGSNMFIDYHRDRKKLLRRASVMEEVQIMPSSVCVAYWYVQNGESKWGGTRCA